jgi:hypothetical protein
MPCGRELRRRSGRSREGKTSCIDHYFVHSTGHGLGLKFMKVPRSEKGPTKLAAGMAITIEPGVYIEGWGAFASKHCVGYRQRLRSSNPTTRLSPL